MASVKVKVRPSCIVGNVGTLYYQVTHRRVVKQITTDVHIFPHQLSKDGHVVADDGGNAILQNRIDSDVALLCYIIREFEMLEQQTGKEFSAADITNRFRSKDKRGSVIDFMAEHIRFLLECNRFGTAKNYRTVMKNLSLYLEGRKLSFTEITTRFAEQYNDYLTRKGLVKNSISFHMRILRAVYNKAVRKGLAEQSKPFQNVYTGVDKTPKRAVDKNVISWLIGLDLSRSSPLSFARDIFLFSLYTRGMSFVDIAFLKRENIRDGAIYYSRRKTKQALCIRIEPCIQQIIDRYAGRSSVYIFPILKSEDIAVAYPQYRAQMAYHNRLLKRLSKMLGLQQGLSFYVARHSWATLARDSNVPVSIISAGMGHASERTTRIYLTSLENSLIDNANRGILNQLNNMFSQ